MTRAKLRLAILLVIATILAATLIVLITGESVRAQTHEQILCHYGLRDGGERRMFEDEHGQLYGSMDDCRISKAQSCRFSARDVIFTTLQDWLAACANVPTLRSQRGPTPQTKENHS